MNFQEMILALQQFWAAQGCVLWNPYNVQVGAGTNNPATLLRVLGPEPWRVAYVEPCIRPDDGRYGENPNRMQRFLQYQVILKPEPGNPQELYLESLAALGIHARDNDIRFVEDNWQSPPLGAWGLGWEVWLNGQEIAQFTYFQQAAGLPCDPVSVEITYGLERMAMAIQGVDSVWDVCWQGELTYGDVFRDEERAYCQYYFEIADVQGLRAVYETYQKEHERALEKGAVLPAYDYVLKCNHIFNVLDARGAVGVTERAQFFRTMHGMTLACARAYLAERETLGFPWREKLAKQWPAVVAPEPEADDVVETVEDADFLLEIGVEELPPAALLEAEQQLNEFAKVDLLLENYTVYTTPRRLALRLGSLPTSPELRGPPASRAYNADGSPTAAAIGFARQNGISLEDLHVEQRDGGEYVVARMEQAPADILAEGMPALIHKLRFSQTMRWNETSGEFSRPIRWLVALLGKQVIPLQAAGLTAGRETRGPRQYGSPVIQLASAADYESTLKEHGILADQADRRAAIQQQLTRLAKVVGAQPPVDEELLDEVTHLVEAPTVLRGDFDQRYLALPDVVLTTVMKKHQRYFALQDDRGALLPHFLAVRNGDGEGLDHIRKGNDQVLAARFADAQFFYEQDRKQPLEAYLPRLETLTFHEKLGSMRDKSERLARLAPQLGELLGYPGWVKKNARQAARLCKADLATQMVVELTALQGEMGRIYALEDDISEDVAQAIYEHWLPRHSGDALPQSKPGILLALADRLDSLVGLMGEGLEAISTADPFGLRRYALGMIQIVIRHEIDVSLHQWCRIALGNFDYQGDSGLESRTKLFNEGFINARIANYFKEKGYSQDQINAIGGVDTRKINIQKKGKPVQMLVGLKELSQWMEHENWTSILDGYARCARIAPSNDTITQDPSLFTEEAECALYEEYQCAQEQVTNNKTVDTFLSAIENMLPAITRFFDEVLVMAEGANIRRNRLALLQGISSLSDDIVDLRELPGF